MRSASACDPPCRAAESATLVDICKHCLGDRTAAGRGRKGTQAAADATFSAMDLDLGGWRVLLLGAGRGLGGAAALALARDKASVALVARTRAAVEERARLCLEGGATRAIAIAADATDPDQLARAVHEAAAQLSGLDALVTLVGGGQ